MTIRELFVIGSTVMLLATPKANAQYDNLILGGDEGLSCEVVLCLSSMVLATGLAQCADPLFEYFKIKVKGTFGTKWGATERKRKKFLSLCPTNDEKVASSVNAMPDKDHEIPDEQNPEPEPEPALQRTGVVWKPSSEKNGNLVVLTPSYKLQKVAVYSPDGALLATGSNGGIHNGGRRHYRFSRPGRSFPKGSVILIGGRSYVINNPGSRVN